MAPRSARIHSISTDIPPLHTDITIIVDRSFSMRSMNGSPMTMVSELLSEQKKIAMETEQSIHLTLVSFDNESYKCIDNKDVKKIAAPKKFQMEEWLEPRGATRLIDTMMEEIKAQRIRVNKYKQNLSNEVQKLNPIIRSVTQIITDGQDNRSKASDEDLNTTIIAEKKNGTTFVFLAANQDAIKTAERFGIDQNTAMTIGADQQTSLTGMQYANEMIRNITRGSSEGATPQFSNVARRQSVSINGLELLSNAAAMIYPMSEEETDIPYPLSSSPPPLVDAYGEEAPPDSPTSFILPPPPPPFGKSFRS